VEDKKMPDIEYRSLGSSGLLVSTVGLGCNNFGRTGTATESQEGTNAVVSAAIDAGITLFDTADIYGAQRGLSETLMGEALKGRRNEIVLATKFGLDMDGANGPDWGARASRRYVRLAVEASLRRLQTDWIDLYQLHTPDPHTPISETLDVLDDLVREGKVRYLGHSNLSGWQIAEAEFTARAAGSTHFVSAQNEYSLLQRDAEDEVLPAVNAYGLGFLPFFPLYNGLLTGKFSRPDAGGAKGPADSRIMMLRPHLAEQAPWDALEAYAAFCAERGIGMLEATFAWLLAQPGLTSVIAGTTRVEQVVQNAAAGTAWKPTVAEVDEISALFDL
jgi:aryl-alcohol dehydrogenase-like predicted oxidoreductase